MNAIQRENQRRSRAEGKVATGEQRHSYYGAVYQSSYDRAGLQQPMWTCNHDHHRLEEATRCAELAIFNMERTPTKEDLMGNG